MARRTVFVPDDLDQRVQDYGTVDDTYSGLVQDALEEYLERRERPTEA